MFYQIIFLEVVCQLSQKERNVVGIQEKVRVPLEGSGCFVCKLGRLLLFLQECYF